MDPVLPGQVMALPVHLAETGRIRWRPVGSNYLWSEPQLLPNLLQLPEAQFGFHRPVVCYPYHPSDGAFRCCITVMNYPVPAAEADTFSHSKGGRKLSTGRANVRDNLGIGLSNGSEAVKSCLFWEITLKAPLVIKNCLPSNLTLKIESGAGVVNSVCAPEVSNKLGRISLLGPDLFLEIFLLYVVVLQRLLTGFSRLTFPKYVTAQYIFDLYPHF